MECILCCSDKDNQNKAIEKVCPNGHSFHISCVQKQFKAECPLCRVKINIIVSGKLYTSESDFPEDTRHSFYECTETDREIVVSALVQDIHDTLDEVSDELYNLFTPNYRRLQSLAKILRDGSYEYTDIDEAQRLNSDFQNYVSIENQPDDFYDY